MLAKRILSALVLMPVAGYILYVGDIYLIGFSFLILAICNYEYFNFSLNSSRERAFIFTLLNLLLPLAYMAKCWNGFVIAILVLIMASFFLLLLFTETETHQSDFKITLPATFLGICYLGVIGSTLVIATLAENSNLHLAWLLLITIASDTSAYFGGTTIKGPKLAERISPKKTISGSICGLLGAILASGVAAHYLKLEGSLAYFIFWGAIAGLLVQIGDLVESFIKRTYGVKDSGTTIPGHGGFLDRVDGLIFACPLLIYLFN